MIIENTMHQLAWRPHYNARMPKRRLDLLLVERGLSESRAKAQALIMAGQVRVEAQVVLKAGSAVDPGVRIEVDRGPRFVSRGGEKLDAALEAFDIDVRGRVCADVGASTGGFTDCLLQRGAAKVYAIDVGKGILHWRLRNDPRVVVMEKTNARYLESLPEAVSLATVDASFISLRSLLPVVKGWLGGNTQITADLVALVKPQFEAGRKEVRRGSGVIREAEIHRRVLLEVLAFAQSEGLGVRGLVRSPLLGPKGNTEFLAWLSPSRPAGELQSIVERALADPEEGNK
jgi:23S rRNA (cytidine1920-2'-O)/16S rRNA (cytidine1409-2'-O)-methyltransferase